MKVETRGRKRIVDYKLIAQWLDQNTDASLKDAANEFGVAISTVYRAIKHYKVRLTLHEQKLRRRKRMARYVFNTNSSVADAARIFGVTEHTVRTACRIYSVDPPKRIESFSPSREALIALWVLENCKTAKDAADEFGVSENHAWYCCNRFGVRPARKEQTPKVKYSTLEIVAALQNTDEPQSAIAKRFRISKQMVFKIATKAREAGIKFPRDRAE